VGLENPGPAPRPSRPRDLSPFLGPCLDPFLGPSHDLVPCRDFFHGHGLCHGHDHDHGHGHCRGPSPCNRLDLFPDLLADPISGGRRGPCHQESWSDYPRLTGAMRET